MPRGIPAMMPSRRQLQHWERVCRYLDSQPYRAVRFPFPAEPPMSVKLFKRMARFGLVRHVDLDCSYRLARSWERILRRLWEGVSDEDAGVWDQLDDTPTPFIVDRGVDTLYVSLLVPRSVDPAEPVLLLPEPLAKICTDLKERAQAQDTDVETPWRLFDVPLNMWKSGVGAGAKKRGVSWSFLLRNDLLMLRLRRAPLDRLIGSLRFSAHVLWQYGPRQALDAAYALLHEMWADEGAFAALTWQLAQLHLCVDVAHFQPHAGDLDRVLTHARKKALHVPSVDEEETPYPSVDDVDADLLMLPDDWDDLGIAEICPDEGYDEDVWDEDQDGADADEADEATSPLEEAGAKVYLYAKRASGFAFASAKAPLSGVWYDKELEERLSGKTWMRVIHEAGGWRPGMPLYRVEIRFGNECLREMQHGAADAAWVRDPWQALEHLNDYWAYGVGLPDEQDHAPDVTHRGWMRLAVPVGEKRSQWPTDPVWQIIQRADFGQGQPPMPLLRKAAAVHDPQAMDAALTLSMELRSFVQAIEDWIERTGREDYWREVREKARSLGQPVPMLPDGVLLSSRGNVL